LIGPGAHPLATREPAAHAADRWYRFTAGQVAPPGADASEEKHVSELASSPFNTAALLMWLPSVSEVAT
jgi:hypothetical protein